MKSLTGFSLLVWFFISFVIKTRRHRPFFFPFVDLGVGLRLVLVLESASQGLGQVRSGMSRAWDNGMCYDFWSASLSLLLGVDHGSRFQF